jgi:hypothetical protein
VNSLDQWTDFFVASVGASAALAGLVAVAISVNIKPILDNQSLPERAATTVAILVMILAGTSVALIKAQSLRALGTELLVFGLAGSLPPLRSTRAALGMTPRRPWSEQLFHIVLGLAPPLLIVVAGALLITRNADGLFWLGAAVICGYFASMLNAWVLLIEILR